MSPQNVRLPMQATKVPLRLRRKRRHTDRSRRMEARAPGRLQSEVTPRAPSTSRPSARCLNGTRAGSTPASGAAVDVPTPSMRPQVRIRSCDRRAIREPQYRPPTRRACSHPAHLAKSRKLAKVASSVFTRFTRAPRWLGHQPSLLGRTLRPHMDLIFRSTTVEAASPQTASGSGTCAAVAGLFAVSCNSRGPPRWRRAR
jgi:hypothetical protein